MNDINTLNTNIHIRPELRGVICCKPKKKIEKKTQLKCCQFKT